MLRRLAAMRGHMRKREVLGEHDGAMPAAVGMSVQDVEDMYRLLAIAKYEDRYVIPQAHAELGQMLMQQQGTCGLDFEGGPGNCGMVVPESEAGAEGFMLTEQPTELDIIQMLGEQREKRRGGAVMTLRERKRAATATTHKLCSLLLQYPDQELLDARVELSARRAGASRHARAEGAPALLRVVGRRGSTRAPAALRQDV